MRKSMILTTVLLALGANSVMAQPQHYDPFLSLNGEAGSKAVTAALAAGSASTIGDASDLNLAYKMGVSDQLEVGANIGVGVLNEGRSSFSTLLIGAKYGLSDARAVSVNLGAPIGDAEDPGLSIDLINVQELGGMTVNQHLQIGLLKGFAAAGANIDLLLEPVKEINDKMTLFSDVVLSTNTDSIADLSIDLAPNLDIMLSDTMLLNAGIAVNVYDADLRNEDIAINLGIVVGL